LVAVAPVIGNKFFAVKFFAVKFFAVGIVAAKFFAVEFFAVELFAPPPSIVSPGWLQGVWQLAILVELVADFSHGLTGVVFE
jgi:hypothetical protein